MTPSRANAMSILGGPAYHSATTPAGNSNGSGESDTSGLHSPGGFSPSDIFDSGEHIFVPL